MNNCWRIFFDVKETKYYLFLHANEKVMKCEIARAMYEELNNILNIKEAEKMTDNESIKRIKKVGDYIAQSNAWDIRDELYKCCDTIEKDLEILEIIKQKAKGNRFFKGCLLRMFQEHVKKKTYLDNPPRKIEENYYKVKEWLEND